MPNQPIAQYQPLQALGSNTFSAAASGSVTLAAKVGFQTVITSVTVSCGFSTATVHGIWTISDGVWTQSFYILMSPTIPSTLPLLFNPGLYTTNANTAITVSMPAISQGSPYSFAVTGFYL